MDRILNPIVELLTPDYNHPKYLHNLESGNQICSLASTDKFLILGSVNEIIGWEWKSIASGKTKWSIKIPTKMSMDHIDVNSLWLSDDQENVYAGCGDNNIYVFNLEDGSLISTFKGHSNFVHSVHGK